MHSDEGSFWDKRYREEGAIWGEGPSPTAVLLASMLQPAAQTFDVGFGYGRDLLYLAERGFQVSGIEASASGHEQARRRLADRGLRAATLYHGRFETIDLPEGRFDAVLSHRMAHLLTTPGAVAAFAARTRQILRPGGLLALAARSPRDLAPAEMLLLEPGVYEYRSRPGHRIRYWDDDAVRLLCSAGFDLVSSQPASEPETQARPVCCQLLLLITRQRQATAASPATPAFAHTPVP
jgi:SAM-dependent methyltransferase